MKTHFVDTFYLLALANPRDPWHAKIMNVGVRRAHRFLLTDCILLEVADALASPGQRHKFRRILDTLREDRMTTIVPCDRDLLNRGVDLYGQRKDKDWPLTDCISFVVMTDFGVTEALTADVHFKQAGFVPLFA